jgi:hypothetical protein
MDIIEQLQALRVELEDRASFGNQATLKVIEKLDELVALLVEYNNNN